MKAVCSKHERAYEVTEGCLYCPAPVAPVAVDGPGCFEFRTTRGHVYRYLLPSLKHAIEVASKNEDLGIYEIRRLDNSIPLYSDL